MKYLKSKLLLFIIALLALTTLSLTCISSILYYSSATSQSEESASQLASAYKRSIDTEMQVYRSNLERVAVALADSSLSPEQVNEILKRQAEVTGLKYLAIADSQGKTSVNTSLSDELFFQEAQKGNAYINSPKENAQKELTVLMGAPIGSSGKVLYGEAAYEEFVKIITSIKVGEGGYAFAVNSEGKTVLHPDAKSVAEPIDYIEAAKTDSSYAPIANIFKKLLNKETGIGYSNYKGVKRLVAFTPLDGPEGWGVAITTPVTQVMSNLYKTVTASMILVVIWLLISVVVINWFAKRITSPITAATRRIELLAQGDLHEDTEQVRGQDESARLTLALQKTIQGLRAYITDISEVLHRVAEKDLTVQSDVHYGGDFQPIKEALNTILLSLNQTFGSIQQSAFEVNAGSEQVSLGAQHLSQSSTEQTATVEQLTDSLENISQRVTANAKNAESMAELSKNTTLSVEAGNKQMQDMLTSMGDMDESSKKILNVIKVINDIARQTNILALNAAVEAARAGAAGKGFAVVADEVRNLAAKSAEAAKTTEELIEKTIISVQNSMLSANMTANSLTDVFEKIENVDKLISEIADSSKEQAQSINELSQGMEQISAATQSNSATAQESAATSEELFHQSQILDELVREFKTTGAEEKLHAMSV